MTSPGLTYVCEDGSVMHLQRIRRCWRSRLPLRNSRRDVVQPITASQTGRSHGQQACICHGSPITTTGMYIGEIRTHKLFMFTHTLFRSLFELALSVKQQLRQQCQVAPWLRRRRADSAGGAGGKPAAPARPPRGPARLFLGPGGWGAPARSSPRGGRGPRFLYCWCFRQLGTPIPKRPADLGGQGGPGPSDAVTRPGRPRCSLSSRAKQLLLSLNHCILGLRV